MRSGYYGRYYEDCFIIKLNTDLDFENLGNYDNTIELGTFIHEYLHFLQNISTTYGNFSLAVYYAKVMDILYNLANKKEKNISRVLPINKDIEYQATKCEIARGDMDSWTYECYDFICIEDVIFQPDESMEEYQNDVLPVIKLLLVKDQKIEHKELNFGAMCIMESMADMLERKAYGRSKVGEYPQYDICEKLWAYFFKDNHDNELLFRLCEYALMGENPGQDFYCAISAMREMGSIDKEFIDNFFENSFNIHYGKRYKEWHEQMMSFFNEIIKKDNIYMKRLHQYILNSYEKIYEIRKNNPLYFTKIYMHESQIIKRLLLGLLKESEACPLIIDKNNGIWTATQYDEEKSLGMQVFAAIYAL